MDYFIISQDERIPGFVEPAGILKLIGREQLKFENLHTMDDLPVQVDAREGGGEEYVDFIENPIPLVSEKLKEILEKYDAGIFFKPVVIADRKRMRQDLYWLMVPDHIACLSPKTEFNKDGTVRWLVIDEKKAAESRIFTIDGIMEDFIVIRLDVAESLLRRGFRGFRLKRTDRES